MAVLSALVSVHTDDPGETGANEVPGRKSTTFKPDGEGTFVVFDLGAGTYSHVGLWSNEGEFLGSATLGATLDVAGALILSLSLAEGTLWLDPEPLGPAVTWTDGTNGRAGVVNDPVHGWVVESYKKTQGALALPAMRGAHDPFDANSTYMVEFDVLFEGAPVSGVNFLYRPNGPGSVTGQVTIESGLEAYTSWTHVSTTLPTGSTSPVDGGAVGVFLPAALPIGSRVLMRNLSVTKVDFTASTHEAAESGFGTGTFSYWEKRRKDFGPMAAVRRREYMPFRLEVYREGVTIARYPDGTFAPVREVTEELEAVEGIRIYYGGKQNSISSEEADELEAAGYGDFVTVTAEDAYNQGPYGEGNYGS